MGWTLNIRKQTVRVACLFLALATMTIASIQRSTAYVPPPGGIGYNNLNTDGSFTDDTFLTMGNSYVQLSVGLGKNEGGSIGVFTTTTNPTDPYDTLLYYESLIPKDTPKYVASHVFVRVDGGINNSTNGMDYEWGQPDTTKAGQWLQYPTGIPSVRSGHMVARWQTYAYTKQNTNTGNGGNNGSGGTTSVVVDPKIEVDLIASFIHNQVRFQFNIINNDPGHSHTVGLVFEQAHALTTSAPPPYLVGTTVVNNHILSNTSSPLRIPNQPYLRTEALWTGTQIPAYWEIQQPYANQVGNFTGTAHSVRGTLRPTATSGNEPTVPSRFALGQSSKLDGFTAPPTPANGTAPIAGPSGRYFDTIWNFTPNSSIRFDNVGAPYGSIALYYDEQPVAPGQTVTITSYIGQSDSSIDVGTPLGLVVTSPTATNYDGTKGNLPFTINAYVTNLLDLQAGGGVALAPVGVSLDLPAGLKFNNDVSNKIISSIAAGAEGTTSWSVVADGTKSGLLTYTVTAAGPIGPGKTVQRSIYVPNIPAIDLVGNATSKGLYQMISLPLDTRGDLITSVLYPGQNANLVTPDVVVWNSATGLYDNATTFELGKAYWIRTRSSTNEHITINTSTNGGYGPLTNQVQPTATAFTVNYSQGWNQIGNPYVYPINFSEIQVFDPATMTINTIADASSTVNQLVLPAVYTYDTSDPSAAKWHNVLLTTTGFQMQPYLGYWVYLRRANLQFIYPGVDIPGVTVTRAAKIGVGLSRQINNTNPKIGISRGASNNWQLKISATSDSGYDPDNYIGVAPDATDNLDNFKYSKPPSPNRSVSLDIVNPTWEKNGRYAVDLRSATIATKTWNLNVTSTKPNEAVTLAGPASPTPCLATTTSLWLTQTRTPVS